MAHKPSLCAAPGPPTDSALATVRPPAPNRTTRQDTILLADRTLDTGHPRTSSRPRTMRRLQRQDPVLVLVPHPKPVHTGTRLALRSLASVPLLSTAPASSTIHPLRIPDIPIISRIPARVVVLLRVVVHSHRGLASDGRRDLTTQPRDVTPCTYVS